MAKYQTLSNVTDLDLRGLLNFPNLDTPLFYPIFLSVLFFSLALSLFFREINREGKGNLFSSLAIAGYATSAVALVLSLMSLIQVRYFIIIVTISLTCQVLFVLTGKFDS